MDNPVDWTPALRLALTGAVLALLPLAWVWRRHRREGPLAWLRGLTLVTLFLTFDLVLFGAFTRLTDSGLGCPDWPGCYGHASPIGAHTDIQSAQTAQPTGPVTHGKAWVEMVHRYLATAVGALITAMMALAWWLRRREGAPSPGWATATFVWVCLQGAFGAWTVTLKLYPAIVTAHLLGGIVLLALLAWQVEAMAPPRPLIATPGLHRGLLAVAALVGLQIALGGWVSTNYAVLACTDFPTCQGTWWPPMDFEAGFTVRRELGQQADGSYLPFAALTAIHVTHRIAAVVVLAALAGLALALRRAGEPRGAGWVAALAAWQLVTGLSNVILDWPLVAAVSHTGGAAALAVVLTRLIARSRRQVAQRAGASLRRVPA